MRVLVKGDEWLNEGAAGTIDSPGAREAMATFLISLGG